MTTRPIPIETNRSVTPLPPKRRVVLLVYHRDGVEVVPLVFGRAATIGRGAPADVIIADDWLSRSHARFTLIEGDTVEVEDLGSLNGTKIDGRRVQRGSLRPGEQAMLGAVAATVHVFAGDEAPPLGLEGHDAFLAATGAEIARSRYFRRTLAVLMVHAGPADKKRLPEWCPRVRQLLRPVDHIGYYGAGEVEILLPESSLDEALLLARSIIAGPDGEPALACGVAAFPEHGSSPGALLSAAREAGRSVRPGEPPKVAPSALSTVHSSAQTGGEINDVVLHSPAMRELAQTVTRAARANISLLVRGETGSGKEVLAQIIHRSGPRRDKPLVCVNCAAIPPSLVESTLFGHVKGSFTGAIADRKGVFEEADGGTLLLDEIGELPAAAQAALLRVLETKRITRVGSPREIPVNVRVIAATHRDLESMSRTGAFREDLFYRLNAMEMSIPPLRDRREDITPLAVHFLRREVQAAGREPMTVEPEALALLERYSWPGNVRELRNTIERAVVISEGQSIGPQDLPERIRGGSAPVEAAPLTFATPSVRAAMPALAAPIAATGVGIPPVSAQAAPVYTGTFKERMRAFERDTLIAALREAGGHQTEAARRLDMPLRTLQFKIKEHGITKSYGAGDGA